ncbi:MAG: hypothetical protein NXH75_11465 [Halobacteriovoraceae bacterium]|nr:hypothetical protein [Halobacteriovoraceae bacterium]
MKNKQTIFSFALFILFSFSSCKTPPSTQAAQDLLSLPLMIPFAVSVMSDNPGPYGNWWRKTPLDWEKENFEKALKGPLSPKDGVKVGDFVGWFGVVIDCTNNSKGGSLITFDHRHAGSNNVYFGVRDSNAIHTVSLFGDGKFSSEFKKPCKDSLLEGDLIRAYGTVTSKSKNRVKLMADKSRVWPRTTYEIAPEKVYRSEETKKILRDSSGWPQLKYDKSLQSRGSSVDAFIMDKLKKKLKSTNPELRARSAYTIGEMGNSNYTKLLNEAFETEKDEKVKKTLEFAIKRSLLKSGPFWKPSSNSPYWL